MGHTPCFEECWGWTIDLMLHHWKIRKRIITLCSWRRINVDFFFFLIWKSWIFSWNWKFWLIFFFFFWKQPKKYEPNAPSPKALFENFLLFFFSFFFWNMKICSLPKSEEDEDGVKVMKIYSWWFFFFFEKPVLWIRITLARS